MRILPTDIHGILDYTIGLMMILAPWLFGFADGTAMQYVPILLGLGIIGYSMFTRYEFGLFPMLDMRTHLLLDIAGGLMLASSPWLFGFPEWMAGPCLVVGVFEVGTALITETQPRPLVGLYPTSLRSFFGT